MTTEVAIANAQGVALATDSAVTIDGQKIYNSALKLFSLSKTEPVGIMIFGGASILDTPWETLIKVFRKNLKNQSFDNLRDYAYHFISFLEKKPSIFPEHAELNWIMKQSQAFFDYLQNKLTGHLKLLAEKNGGFNDADVIDHLKRLITEHHDRFQSKDYCKSFNKTKELKIQKEHKKLFSQCYEQFFSNVGLPTYWINKLFKTISMALVREVETPNASGIVVAGFGEKQLFPEVVTYNIYGGVEGRLKYTLNEGKSYRVDRSGACSIIPFAQEDMIASFLQGLNPSLRQFMDNYIQTTFDLIPELVDRSPARVSKKDRTTIKNTIVSGGKEIIKEFSDAFSKEVQAQHIDPILNMVGVLPKDELAAMAEALVSLTAFKRKMTSELETVGGPVDVVVISKGDGLVWVKRKLYFPSDINHHFFNNYFNGVYS